MLSSPLDVFVSGTVAGATEISTTIPLEVIKTQMQLHPNKYSGTLHAGKTIFQNNGFKSLYSGLPVLLVQVSLKVGFRFTVYDQLKQYFSDHHGNISNRNKILSGFLTGFIEGSLIPTPTERIKVLQQNQINKNVKLSGLQTINNIIYENGIRGLWKGWFPTMTRQCINTGVRLALYEPTKDFYLHQEKSTINSNIGIISGGTVGFIGAIITHPVDVVKSHTQAYNSSIIKNTKNIFSTMGAIGFFQGLRPRLWRMTLSQAITFGVYELVYNTVSQ